MLESSEEARKLRAELLRLSNLLDAQERETPGGSPALLCALLHGLARVQVRLGHFNDALLFIRASEELGFSPDGSSVTPPRPCRARAVSIMPSLPHWGL